jgi:hypothetical protein
VNLTLVESLDRIVSPASPVVSVAPVTLPAPGRAFELDVRVSAPVTGADLPIILFSHGNGSSLDGYAPLTNFWASRGFAVIQPTHLDSRRLGITIDDPRFAHIWLDRIQDMKRILDQLDAIQASMPGLSGRLDPTRIAAAGHSWGAQTVQVLLGARVLDRDGRPGEDLSDARVKAGILLSASGTGGADLNPFAAEHFPFLNPSFAELATPALVVAGDHDRSDFLSNRGPGWRTDAYRLSPGATHLLTLFGAEHTLGGISGYEVAETTDENPQRVSVLQRLTWAYLRSALNPTDPSWHAASSILNESAEPVGRIDSK